jgi:hypothetical protein
MKAINKFFVTSSSIAIFSATYSIFLIIGILSAIVIVLPDSLELIQFFAVAMISLPLAGLLTLMNSMDNSSSAFWKYADNVEKLIENAETKDELRNIYNNEFQRLVKMQMGRPHTTMIVKLDSILKTKYKYIK